LNVVILEDDRGKMAEIVGALKDEIPSVELRECYSYRSALNECVRDPPDVILLDMSVPTFDVSVDDAGGRPREFGGKDLLWQLSLRGLRSRGIVVTQFDIFGTGEGIQTLSELTTGVIPKRGCWGIGKISRLPSG
jgi:DNA-binding NarL/FixJ family response regulator